MDTHRTSRTQNLTSAFSMTPSRALHCDQHAITKPLFTPLHRVQLKSMFIEFTEGDLIFHHPRLTTGTEPPKVAAGGIDRAYTDRSYLT
jgi:hypothetical protein